MESKKPVARLLECWNSGQLGIVDEVMNANFIRHEPDVDSRSTSREEYKQTVSQMRSQLSDFHSEAIDTIEQGNKVAFRFETTGRHNNAQVVFEGVNILRVEGGKVVEDWVYYDATGLHQKLARAKAATASS